MTEKPKPSRGGRRAPLPRMTITIPNYAKYQEPLKQSGARRLWVRFDRSTPNDMKLTRCTLEARGIFYSLVMVSDEGTISDIGPADLARCLNGDYRTIMNGIKQLSEEGLLAVEFHADGTQTDSEPVVNGKGADSEPIVNGKGTGSEPQVILRDTSANDAGLMPLTDRQTDKTDREENPLPSQTPSASQSDVVNRIVSAMAAAEIPAGHIDPAIGYRAKAAGFIRRKSPEIETMVYANWIAMAISAVGACDDWEVRVNKALSDSRAVGSYVQPERPRVQARGQGVQDQVALEAAQKRLGKYGV